MSKASVKRPEKRPNDAAYRVDRVASYDAPAPPYTPHARQRTFHGQRIPLIYRFAPKVVCNASRPRVVLDPHDRWSSHQAGSLPVQPSSDPQYIATRVHETRPAAHWNF
jgi:hypothetical protein